MFRFIQEIFFWLRGGSLKLLVLAGIILLVWGTLSPIGTLVWWAEEGASVLGWRKNRPQVPSSGSNTAKSSQLNCYIVYLSGVGDFSANQLTTGEEIFLKRLVQTHPNCVAVSDVFPYSVANESLGAPERLLSPLWSFADQAQGWLGITNVIIKIRNLWRFAISVDPRYGPVYNQGIAIAIMQRMQAMHPIAQNSTQPLKIILIGTSGGVQVALGAASFLDEWLDPQITVISIGGVFSGKNGFNVTDHVYHLWGRQDWVDDIGSIVFPSRWIWTVGSPFNQARQQNRYTAKMSGSHAHDGTEGYFGTGTATENGTTYVELTLQEVNQLPVWSKKK